MEREAGTNDGCALGHCSTAVSPTPLQLCQIGVSARSPEQLGGSEEGGGGGRGWKLWTAVSRILQFYHFAITIGGASYAELSKSAGTAHISPEVRKDVSQTSNR